MLGRRRLAPAGCIQESSEKAGRLVGIDPPASCTLGGEEKIGVGGGKGADEDGGELGLPGAGEHVGRQEVAHRVPKNHLAHGAAPALLLGKSESELDDSPVIEGLTELEARRGGRPFLHLGAVNCEAVGEDAGNGARGVAAESLLAILLRVGPVDGGVALESGADPRWC